MTQTIFTDYGQADIHRMTLAEIARVCEMASTSLGSGADESIADAYQVIVRAIRSAARYVQHSDVISEALQVSRSGTASQGTDREQPGPELVTATARLGTAVAEVESSWANGLEAATTSLGSMLAEVSASRRDASVVADAVEELVVGVADIKKHARDVGSDGEIAYSAVAMASSAIEQAASICAGLETLVDVLGDVAHQARVTRGRVSAAATRAGQHGSDYAIIAAELRELEVIAKAGASKVRRQLPSVRHDTDLATEASKRACDAVLRMRDQASTIAVTVADHHTAVRRVSADSQYVALTMDRVLEQIAAVTASGDATRRALSTMYDTAAEVTHIVDGLGRRVPQPVVARGPAHAIRSRH